jgi:hypothetical protein
MGRRERERFGCNTQNKPATVPTFYIGSAVLVKHGSA